MKKILFASVMSLLPIVASAAQVRPVIGLDYVHSYADLKIGYEEAVQDKYDSLAAAFGFKIDNNFGAEAFYQRSKKEDTKILNTIQTSFDAVGADAVFYLPLEKPFELVPSLGLGWYTVKGEAKIGEYDSEMTEDGLGARAGLALQINFNDYVATRIGGRAVKMFDFDTVNYLAEFNVGMRFTF